MLQTKLTEQSRWFGNLFGIGSAEEKKFENTVKKIFNSVLVFGPQRQLQVKNKISKYTNFTKEVIRSLSRPPFNSKVYINKTNPPVSQNKHFNT